MMRDRNRLPIAPRFEIYQEDARSEFSDATFILIDREVVSEDVCDYSAYVGLFDRKRDAVRVARRIIRGEGA